ncbi:unnamed protein product [Mesocestoides corti]|uniref:H15 domain-containing protein n=1 Tax=Mesocestoides corti TaxID=53468 RepID=A0A0R3U447_MESCO|nr:unnamed protein product [Mesocestoides corti]
MVSAGAKSAKVSGSSATHPPFTKMIVDAISALKEKGGSSRQAIIKYIIAHYNVEDKVAKASVRRGLKSATSAGKIVCVKGAGAVGSFKVAQQTEAKPVVRKPKKASKKPAAKAAAVVKAATPKPKKTAVSRPKKAAKPSKGSTPGVKKSKAAKARKSVTKRTPKKSAASKK